MISSAMEKNAAHSRRDENSLLPHRKKSGGLLPAVFLFLFLVCWNSISGAQTIFPGLTGQVLMDSLVARYKPSATLDYTQARSVMFTELNNQNDTVTCVYTGYRFYLSQNSADPIQEALSYQVDTEHTWPQSLGASGQAKSDLHHMYPSRQLVNSSRGNLPFAEIPAAVVDKWFRWDQALTAPPAQNIPEYSRVRFNVAFEPRDDHKGNVARAMFYFYTMYAAQANAAFFEEQKTVLRRWNSLDPVDIEELNRSVLIAGYQQGRENPFILDTTLIARAYFTVSPIAGGGDVLPEQFTVQPNFPNPFNSATVFTVQLPQAGNLRVTVYNIRGQVVQRQSAELGAGGPQRVRIAAGGWASGSYFVKFDFRDISRVRKILLLR